MTAKDQTGVPIVNPDTGENVIVAGNTGDIPPFQFRPKALDEGAEYWKIPQKIAPIWPQDSHVDITVTLSSSFNPTPIDKTPDEYVVLQEKDFIMNNGSEKRTISSKFTVPPAVQNNGTLWGHFYIGLTGSNLDPKAADYDTDRAYYFSYPLTQYLVKKKVVKTRNLLEASSEDDEPEVEEPVGPIVTNHYHPNASLSLIPGFGVQEFRQLNYATKQFLRLEATGARDGTGKNAWYCK